MKDSCGTDFLTGERCVEQVEETEAAYIPSVAFAFRNHLIEVIEELRVKRAVDEENEEKLKNLVAEKHTLLSEHEDTEYKLQQHQDEKELEISLIRKEYELQLKNMQEEKIKNKNYLNSAMLEVKTLKEEIRTLQMSKCSLEKKWSEQERKMVLQSEIKVSNQVQIAGIEEQCKGMSKQIADFMLAEEKLTKNVQEARKLNRQLGFINKHQKCELQSYCSEVTRLKKEHEELKVQLSKQPSEFQHQMFTKQEEIVAIKQQNKMNEYLLSEVKQALKEQEIRCESAQVSLKDAYTLLSRHVESIAACEIENKQLKLQVNTKNSECSLLSKQLSENKCVLQNERENFSQKSEEWKTQELSLQSQLTRLRNDYESLMETYNKLEEVKATLSCSVKELQAEVTEVKEKLNKPKKTTETQVENNVSDVSVGTDKFATCELGIQNTCITSNQETQVMYDAVNVSSEPDKIFTCDLAVQITCSNNSQETQTVLKGFCNVTSQSATDSLLGIDESLNHSARDNPLGIEESLSKGDGPNPIGKEHPVNTKSDTIEKEQSVNTKSETKVTTTEEVYPEGPMKRDLSPKTEQDCIIQLKQSNSQPIFSRDVRDILESPQQSSSQQSPSAAQGEESIKDTEAISLSPLSRFYTKMETMSQERHKSLDVKSNSASKRRKVDDKETDDALDKIEGEKNTSTYTFQFLKFPGSSTDTIPESQQLSENTATTNSPKSGMPLVGILSNISGPNTPRRKGVKRVSFAITNTEQPDSNKTESQRTTLEEEWHRITSVFKSSYPKERQVEKEDEVTIICDDEAEELKLMSPSSKVQIRFKSDRLSLKQKSAL